jgi:hypothetical protein
MKIFWEAAVIVSSMTAAFLLVFLVRALLVGWWFTGAELSGLVSLAGQGARFSLDRYCAARGGDRGGSPDD